MSLSWSRTNSNKAALKKTTPESVLLNEIAALAALINNNSNNQLPTQRNTHKQIAQKQHKHKSQNFHLQHPQPTQDVIHTPQVIQKKRYSNMTLTKPQSHAIASSVPPLISSSSSITSSTSSVPPLMSSSSSVLTSLSSSVHTTAPRTSSASISPPSATYIRKGKNKLLRDNNTNNITNKKITHNMTLYNNQISPSKYKLSVPYSPSAFLKQRKMIQMQMNYYNSSTPFHRRLSRVKATNYQLGLGSRLALQLGGNKSSLLRQTLRVGLGGQTYLKTGSNKLVRNKSFKYVRGGVDPIAPSPKRLAPTAHQSPVTPRGNRVTIDGQTYVKTPRGRSLVRTKNLVARAVASNRVKRSIQNARKKQQYCLFFNKFGKCNNKDCKYVHDPDKVAVCRKFIQGKCEDPNCLLQHKVDADRMPVCWHFLRGICTKDNCPYSHVYVNPQAEVCPDFTKGYCPLGKACKLQHVIVKKPKNQKTAPTTTLGNGEQDEFFIIEPNIDRSKQRKGEVEEVYQFEFVRPRFPSRIEVMTEVDNTTDRPTDNNNNFDLNINNNNLDDDSDSNDNNNDGSSGHQSENDGVYNEEIGEDVNLLSDFE